MAILNAIAFCIIVCIIGAVINAPWLGIIGGVVLFAALYVELIAKDNSNSDIK